MINWKRVLRREPMTRAEHLVHVKRVLGDFVSSMRLLLGDAENYVEMRFACPDTHEGFVLRLQKQDGITPHQARIAAEQERDRLRAELEKAAVIWSSPGEKPPLCVEAVINYNGVYRLGFWNGFHWVSKEGTTLFDDQIKAWLPIPARIERGGNG